MKWQHRTSYFRFKSFGIGLSILGWSAIPAHAKFEVGPEFAIGVPQVLQLGTEGRFEGTGLKVYTDVGYFRLPLSTTVKSIKVASIESGMRYSPFAAPFFMGIAVGLRKITLSADISAFQIDGETLATSADVNMLTFYTSPCIGLSFALGKQVYIGADIGVQIPIHSWTSMDLKNDLTGDTANTDSMLQVSSGPSIDRIAQLVVPRLTLFRLSWYF